MHHQTIVVFTCCRLHLPRPVYVLTKALSPGMQHSLTLHFRVASGFLTRVADSFLEPEHSMRELGFRVSKGGLSPQEASQWYTIVTASLDCAPAQRDAICDLVSNKHLRESCWASPQMAAPSGDPSREGGPAVGTQDVQEGHSALLNSLARNAQLAPYCMVGPGGRGGGGDVQDPAGRGEADFAHS